uniref:Ubiquitin-like domain-containing protein n=1 Tax=Oryza meridionalis TaxID=40149 RepID=A0A0E0CYA8_9ORYZ
MRIYVKTLKGRIISLEVARSDTIASVKDKIYAERGIRTVQPPSPVRELGVEFDEQRRQLGFEFDEQKRHRPGKLHCPDCQVQANVYYCNTEEDNEGCVLQAGGCQFVQCADTVDEGLQKRVEHATQETSCPRGNNMSLMEERLQRILDHMKWMEQFLIVCIIALAYVVFVK